MGLESLQEGLGRSLLLREVDLCLFGCFGISIENARGLAEYLKRIDSIKKLNLYCPLYPS